MGFNPGMLGWATSARRHYRRRGYHVFRGAFPVDEVEAIARAVRCSIPAYRGALRRQDGQFASNDFFPDTQLVRNPLLHPHADLPADLGEIRDRLCGLVTSPALAGQLQELDGEGHYIVHQSLLFFAAQTTELHLDSWSLDTTPRGLTHTVWIPLQDMDHRSGVPCVIPWPRGDVVTEAALGLMPGSADPRDERYALYHQALRAKLLSTSPEVVASLMRKGDCMIWSSLTPHFTLPSHPFPAERLSLQVLIRPAHRRWGDFLSQPFDRNSLQLHRVNVHFSIRS
jgi:hypothetical protein